MSETTIKREVMEVAGQVQDHLAMCLRDKAMPSRLVEAMEYSLLAGGKRLRPVLCLKWAGLCGQEPGAVMDFAAGIECIHTYSLVHDDLPAMDDDDLRRGKPSNHKQFDEATAILAGDGLLTEAFSLMAVTAGRLPAERVLCALAAMARASGGSGMVGGQLLDMEYTGRTGVGLEELKAMHALKTGALIRASCQSGALLAGADAKQVELASTYGAAIGSAFQIVDDILDVTGDEAVIGKPVGSDEEAGKVTYVSLLGLDESKRMAAELVDKAVACLEPFGEAPEAGFLRRLAQYIVDRAH